MKSAILIGFVGMAFVAGCGSDDTGTATGNQGRRSAVLADPVGGQLPPDNPNAPPGNTAAPPDNTAAPPPDPNAPNPSGSVGVTPRLNCPTLCSDVGSCQPLCVQQCTGIGAFTPCLAQLNTFLGCAGGIRLSCTGQGDNIRITPVNPCVDEGEALLQCLGIDISIRTPPVPDNTAGQSNDGPPPGR
jgi:hypothetical protein